MAFSEEMKKKISQAINDKGADKSCERCGYQYFTVLDGYFRQDPQDDPYSVQLGEKSVPSFGVACENCGNLSFMAAKVLLPDEF
ncbi:hypothetical protein [Alkalibacillus almallahensis]|uniref:hypothetical protein n=1 Tax=Alkalibacillus almallahensis TaxID=1379154 RepID=UPI0014210CFF|nr:hypothetical protein [Alkalibacillus almallahensis]NIK10937.1 ribosomal protein S27AE [Alkalibacillus almallahensis]